MVQIDKEGYLQETLARLQESYEKDAKPFIDRLVAIHSMRKPNPIIITLEQARALGLLQDS